MKYLFFGSSLRVFAMVYGLVAANYCNAIVGLPGSLDPTWGTYSSFGVGKVFVPLSSGAVNRDDGEALTQLADGKVLVAGRCWPSSTSRVFCASRLLANGRIDTTFGANGKVLLPVPNGGDGGAYFITELSDGKLLLAGTCSSSSTNLSRICVVRLLANGSVDETYGATGWANLSLSTGNTDFRGATLIDGDKLVVAGRCQRQLQSFDYLMCVARIGSTGFIDTQFASPKGFTFIEAGVSLTTGAFAVAARVDGRLLVVGNCRVPQAFCLTSLNADGSADTSINGGDTETVGFEGISDVPKVFAFDPDGSAVVGGECTKDGRTRLCAARFSPTLALDTNFGSGGIATALMGPGQNYAIGLHRTSTGRYVLTGRCDTGRFLDQALCAIGLTASGDVDSDFAGAGTLFLNVIPNTNSPAQASHLQSDGRLLTIGRCWTGASDDFCALRFDLGAKSAQPCLPDLDGNGAVTAFDDARLFLRIIRAPNDNTMLAMQAKLDLDGDGAVGITDFVIFARVALGFRGDSVPSGLTFSGNAARKTWSQLRSYLVSQCGFLPSSL
jgi:uncharacterized delta-60 repeat protein